MTSKEVKAALKAAREAIRNKEFKEALKQCKTALAEDQDNYNALVFVGVAAEGLEQGDQALKAYRRATETSPEQLLAWQGISALYNKYPDLIPKEEMIGVYEKLIELNQNDEIKKQEVMLKLLPLIPETQLDKAVSLYEELLQKRKGEEKSLHRGLVELLGRQPTLSPQQEAMLQCSLQVMIEADGDSQDRGAETHVRTLLRLIRKREPEQLFEECTKLLSRFPQCQVAMETKLQLLLDRQIAKDQASEVAEIKSLVSGISQLLEGENSVVLMVAQGYLSFIDGQYAAAKESLQKSVDSGTTMLCAHFYLARVLFRVHSPASCLKACERASAMLSGKGRLSAGLLSDVQRQIRLMSAQCCLLQATKHSLVRGLDLLDEESSEEGNILRAFVHLELGETQYAQEILGRLKERQSCEVMALEAWLDYHNKDFKAAAKKLEECVRQDPTNASYQLKLGRVLLKQISDGASLHDQCFNTLLKAAKLDPYLSGAFLYLGHFYSRLKKDQQRAKKCYQKAYDLDSGNGEAGAALCDMMVALGDEESVQGLLKRVTDTASAGEAKWAWLRLGLAQVRAGDPLTAGSSFQAALRADPADSHAWECLAESYLQRGSFTAALKAFNKATELHPESIYCHYQIASIKQKLGTLTEAVEEYQVILTQSPDYVPALKGLGESYLLLSQRHLNEYLIGLAVDRCQQAIACLTRAATRRPDLSCLWKLLGDCFTSLHPLHASVRVSVPRRLCQVTGEEEEEEADLQVNKETLMELATRCYGRGLKVFPDSAALWHDLGVALFHLCREGAPGRGEVAQRCVGALQKALSLDPLSHLSWTALGVVAASPYIKDLALAQHCFIKSVQCENNNAVAWTNLGVLYLQNNNIQLAHEAFKVAQSLDPEYVAGWIGQALVAEAVGHEEAMDLFRHTTQLAVHTESCLGYGHWVISTLLDVKRQDTEAFQYCIRQMAAIPAATDALARYTEMKKDDALAFNMLGLLLEHQARHVSALQAFRRAVELGERNNLPQENLQLMRLNLARSLSKNQCFSEARQEFESNIFAGTFPHLVQWALMMYQAGQLTDSYKAYQQALLLAKTDSDQSDVCTALGMVAYKQGRMEDAKSVLFQGFELSKRPLGLFALCALGLLQGDVTLSQAVLAELSVLVQDGERLGDVAALKLALREEQGEDWLGDLRETVSEHGHLLSLHLLFSSCSLRHSSPHNAVHHAKTALQLQAAPSQESLACLAMSLLDLGCFSQVEPEENAFHAAQKAFHCKPDNVSSLCCLISAMHGQALIRHIQKGDDYLLSRELTFLDLALTSDQVTPAQREWCLKQKAVVQILLGMKSQAGETMTQLGRECAADRGLVGVLQCVLSRDQASLQSLVIRPDTPLLFWQILVRWLMEGKQWMEARLLLREALQKASKDSSNIVPVCLVSIAWTATLQLLQDGREGGDGDNTGTLSELEEASQAVSDASHALMQLMQGLVYLSHNPRKAKHHLASALELGHLTSSLGLELCVARRALLYLLHDSHKDQELVQKLLADSLKDPATLDFYKRLTKKS